MKWLVAILMAVTPQVPTADIDTYMREYRVANRIPGLAYAVVGRDGVISQATLGEVTAQTPFLIGSVSKPVTATAVMRLVEAGRVGLDDLVRQHLPWFQLAGGADGVTVRHLLTHTSGLAQWASRTDRFDNSADGLARSVRDLASVRPKSVPGTAHEYSDANYMVLGALVEEVSGQSFGDFLHREVLDPLGMTHSATTAEEASRVGLPAGHRYWFGQPRRFDAGYDTSGVPYGYLAASLEDMSRFAAAQLRLPPPEGLVDTGNGGQYGLGWRTSRLDGTGDRLVWHAGATPGYFAHLVLVPDSGIAVIVLANSYSLGMDGRLAAAAFDLARLTLGAAPMPAPGGDPLLDGAPYALLAVAAMLLGGVVWSVVRLVRPRGRVRRSRVIMVVAGCAVVAGGVAAIPGMLGGDLGQALLWTPDIGWSIVAVIVLACALALARVGAAVHSARSRTDTA